MRVRRRHPRRTRGDRRCRDGEHWLAAYESGGAFDWSVIFDGYRATLDWPTIHFWEQLARAYPTARILLTDRDPERWWDSHVAIFELGAKVEQELTDEQRQWAEAPGFARMQLMPATRLRCDLRQLRGPNTSIASTRPA